MAALSKYFIKFIKLYFLRMFRCQIVNLTFWWHKIVVSGALFHFYFARIVRKDVNFYALLSNPINLNFIWWWLLWGCNIGLRASTHMNNFALWKCILFKHSNSIWKRFGGKRKNVSNFSHVELNYALTCLYSKQKKILDKSYWNW